MEKGAAAFKVPATDGLKAVAEGEKGTTIVRIPGGAEQAARRSVIAG
jgi:hypothetical protein